MGNVIVYGKNYDIDIKLGKFQTICETSNRIFVGQRSEGDLGILGEVDISTLAPEEAVRLFADRRQKFFFTGALDVYTYIIN